MDGKRGRVEARNDMIKKITVVDDIYSSKTFIKPL